VTGSRLGDGVPFFAPGRHDEIVSNNESLEQQADRAAAAGDFVRAKDLLENALAIDSGSFSQWSKLAALRKGAGDLSGALVAIDRALALRPLDFSALLSRAVILDGMGDPAAGEHFGNALAQVATEQDIPAPMRPAIAHARKRWSAHQAALESRLREAIPEHLSEKDRERVERFITNRSRSSRHFHQEPSDFHYPGLPEIEFHDRALFPELSAIEDQVDVIRAEFEALIAAEAAEMVPYIQYPERVPLRQWRELNNNPKWTAIHLLQNGVRVEANARHCPATMQAIASLPQPVVAGASPNAMFSQLAPRTRIPAHTGVANTRLVCHLPLIVPQGCGFRVGATVREWKVGQAFVFDDTIEHEAWNDSDELRVVLIVDLWPPALSMAEREAVSAVIGASGVQFSGG
jgi:aspartyl/asparaginyl beta-hydroxylase (cupin superfamily)